MTISSRPQKSGKVSIDSIAADYVAEALAQKVLGGPYFTAFKNTAPADLIRYHSTLGMHLRNHYNLWDSNHPLTQHWHMYQDCRNMVDGTDYSEDHPDAVSMDILRAIHSKLQSL